MSVLVHCCCAHCAAYTIEYWRGQAGAASGVWYNPNIHPFTEHEHRRTAVQALAEKMAFPLIIVPGYDMPEYFKRVAAEPADRCAGCFRIRLTRTAEVAKEQGFSGFTTTLLISPHQKHELIKQIGEEIAREKGIEFMYADLRKRFSDSRHITKPMDLYRQQYCGCLYSEYERYSNTKI